MHQGGGKRCGSYDNTPALLPKMRKNPHGSIKNAHHFERTGQMKSRGLNTIVSNSTARFLKIRFAYFPLNFKYRRRSPALMKLELLEIPKK